MRDLFGVDECAKLYDQWKHCYNQKGPIHPDTVTLAMEFRDVLQASVDQFNDLIMADIIREQKHPELVIDIIQ